MKGCHMTNQFKQWKKNLFILSNSSLAIKKKKVFGFNIYNLRKFGRPQTPCGIIPSLKPQIKLLFKNS